MTDATLEMYRGTTPTWTVAAKIGGAPLDLTGGTVKFTARRGYKNSILFQRTIGAGIILDTDPTTGVCYVTLLSTDTSALSNEEITLRYDVIVTTASGVTLVVGKGDLLVHPVVGVP